MSIKNNYSKKLFPVFAKWISEEVGKAWVFIFSLSFVIGWLILGPLFKFSDTWQLIINSVSSAVTFLMVFLIQNTQNRENKILNLKLDEIIKATKTANNNSLDLEKLSTKELKRLEKAYQKLGDKTDKKASNPKKLEK
ncbi:low affinity iron permease family protein [Legionella fairfieldensis]|uniref:low affinity iron permease family protein n=1 Tax=Legionella fairfieldensis TaxID=45064 RepID=UPI000685928F|nr:low affinity iron permease family protein [Legionella fairfieldensis]